MLPLICLCCFFVILSSDLRYLCLLTLSVYPSDWFLVRARCLAVSPNFEIAKNNMAIALTDLGTKVADPFNF